MTVGVLLISHTDIAQALFNTVNKIWNDTPLTCDWLEIAFDEDPKKATDALRKKINLLDSGDGVLILTDLAGATPGNIVKTITHHNLSVVSGLNLPMLMKIYNYTNKTLAELTTLSIEGGKNGITTVE